MTELIVSICELIEPRYLLLAAGDHGLTGYDLRLLMALCSRAEPDGSVWVSYFTLSEDVGINESHVSRSVMRLEQSRYISRRRRGVVRDGKRWPVVYQIMPCPKTDGGGE